MLLAELGGERENKMTHLEKVMHEDTFESHEFHDVYDPKCSSCFAEKEEEKDAEPECKICNDSGVVEITKWSGTDDSHDEQYPCRCQED